MDYPEHTDWLFTMLHKYREVIALPGESLGATDKAKHHVKLRHKTKPVFIPAYRLLHGQRQIVDEQVKYILKQGVIQSSRSPWNSLLFLIPKGDKQFRPVIDFRKVNEVTEDVWYPLPVLSDLLMSLGHGNKIFSSFNLLRGYSQALMPPESGKITAFSTSKGHFEWVRIIFCLKSAPITLQRMINNSFSDMLGNGPYLDDLLDVCLWLGVAQRKHNALSKGRLWNKSISISCSSQTILLVWRKGFVLPMDK